MILEPAGRINATCRNYQIEMEEQAMFGGLQPIAPEETPYFYPIAETHIKERGFIGHLRGDFGSNGEQFWMSWWDHHGERKPPAFYEELAAFVQHLQQQGLLHNLSSMQAYCRQHPEARIPGAWHPDVCGFCLQTTQYRYYIRCFPYRGDYNFYIYCYCHERLPERAADTSVSPLGRKSSGRDGKRRGENAQ